MTETAFFIRIGRLFVARKIWTAFYLLMIGLSIGHILLILRMVGEPFNRSDEVFLEINPDSDLSRDIDSIEHNEQDATVTVHFRAGASCQRPFLLGRLSGPALSLIQDWTWQSYADMKTSLTGSYHVPVAGIYNIEIIAVYCSDFTDVDGMDFTKTCVVDPFRNRLSISSSNISVSRLGSAQGYWVANNTTLSSNQENNSTMKNPIMYTRFQPPRCRLAQNPTDWGPVIWPTLDQESVCQNITSTERYMDYHFEYLPSSFMSQLSLADLIQANVKKICIIGASHSHYMSDELNDSGIHVEYVGVKWPHEVSHNPVRQIIHDAACSIFLVAVGQWPASLHGGRPTLKHEYHDQIKVMLHDLKESHPEAEIFMRSIHYNPLSRMISACPPRDWRSPAVISAYNKAIADVCNQFEKVNFVDTNFIVGPMWDSSLDWNHLAPEVKSVEAFYLAAVVLGVLKHNQSSIDF